MLDRSEFMPFQYFKKQKWSGSYKGMRFMFQKAKQMVPMTEEEQAEAAKNVEEGEAVPTEKAVDVLEVACWKEPFSYENTPEEEKTIQYFDFSEEGRELGIEWLENEYESRREEWVSSMKWDWKK